MLSKGGSAPGSTGFLSTGTVDCQCNGCIHFRDAIAMPDVDVDAAPYRGGGVPLQPWPRLIANGNGCIHPRNIDNLAAEVKRIVPMLRSNTYRKALMSQSVPKYVFTECSIGMEVCTHLLTAR